MSAFEVVIAILLGLLGLVLWRIGGYLKDLCYICAETGLYIVKLSENYAWLNWKGIKETFNDPAREAWYREYAFKVQFEAGQRWYRDAVSQAQAVADEEAWRAKQKQALRERIHREQKARWAAIWRRITTRTTKNTPQN
jgi:hypothetical protein